MIKKCFIISHLNCGDLLTINGLIRYYSNIFNIVYVLCKKIHSKTFNQVFLDNKFIIPIFIDLKDDIIPNNHYIFDLYSDCNIIKLGLLNYNWYVLKSNYFLGDLPYSFFKTFYQQCNLDYNIRYTYEKINRNYLFEKHFFNKIMNKYNKYIFVHDNNNEINIINDLPIFHPNKNYYTIESKYYSYWNENISNNLLDYCLIIEKSEEIHVSHSAFFALCLFLNLENVKKKYIYTKIPNIKDYHKNLKDWNIIYI
jgi:hypothetical protein